jgi:hypothetical protein
MLFAVISVLTCEATKLIMTALGMLELRPNVKPPRWAAFLIHQSLGSALRVRLVLPGVYPYARTAGMYRDRGEDVLCCSGIAAMQTTVHLKRPSEADQ